ncbi:MAG: transposase [Flavobacteriales bacterium]
MRSFRYSEVHITLVGCMAHARRYFDKALKNDKFRAEYVLSEIQKLYAIERTAKEYSPEQRHTYRLDHAQPIMEELIKWLHRENQKVLPKSAIGECPCYQVLMPYASGFSSRRDGIIFLITLYIFGIVITEMA